MSYSLDVNILLYSSDTSSPFHAKAKSFLESCMSRSDVLYLSWPTIMSYLRIATHPSIFDEPLTPEEAMANVETLIQSAQFPLSGRRRRILGDMAVRDQRDIRAWKLGAGCTPRRAASPPRGASAVHARPRLPEIRFPRCTGSTRLTLAK